MENVNFEDKLTQLDQLQSSCTGCGLCSAACATYVESGWEEESPRGRLHLAAQFLHGKISLQSDSLSTFDRCLGCQACEPLCPLQVPYQKVRNLVQEIRRDLKHHPISSVERKVYKRWILLAYRIGNRWWRTYGVKWLRRSLGIRRPIKNYQGKSKGTMKGQPTLAICCLQDLLNPEGIDQTVKFVNRLGYSLQIDKYQPCCGAIFERLTHGGEESISFVKEQRRASSLQQKTLKAFLAWMPVETYFLAAGCEKFIKNQHSYSLDFYSWIEKILDQQQLQLYFSKPQEVFYQPYCGVGYRENDPIWRIFQRIEGIKIRELEHPQACCGGFCGESFLRLKGRLAITEKKISGIPQNGTLIISSPDCWTMFRYLTKEKNITLFYPLEFLQQAFFEERKPILQ